MGVVLNAEGLPLDPSKYQRIWSGFPAWSSSASDAQVASKVKRELDWLSSEVNVKQAIGGVSVEGTQEGGGETQAPA